MGGLPTFRLESAKRPIALMTDIPCGLAVHPERTRSGDVAAAGVES